MRLVHYTIRNLMGRNWDYNETFAGEGELPAAAYNVILGVLYKKHNTSSDQCNITIKNIMTFRGELQKQAGYVMIVALLVLTLTAGLALLQLKRSMLNLHQTGNFLEKNMTHYGAESGINHAISWATENISTLDTTDPYWEKTFTHTLDNGVQYEATVYFQLDDGGNVLLYGDHDGDYIFEINTMAGYPLLEIHSEAVLPGGRSDRMTILDATYTPSPPFAIPKAALWVDQDVNGNGVSGTIIGEGPSDVDCPTNYRDSSYFHPRVPDIMYNTVGGVIEYGGATGSSVGAVANEYVLSTGAFHFNLFRDNLLRLSTTRYTEVHNTGNKLPVENFGDNSVLFIDHTTDGTIKVAGDINGGGILYVDGDLEIAGNIEWKGLVLVEGNLTFSGGGTKSVSGAVIAGGDAVALNGAVDIIYNADLINKAFEAGFRMRRTSWKEQKPVITILDNGTAVK